MIQGKEFTDFESDFIAFVEQDIRQGGFRHLLGDTGLCVDEVLEALGAAEMYDCDYLDIEGELNADKLFSDISIRDEALNALKIVEVFTIRIPCRSENENVLFMAVGESQMPGKPYTCYTYGFTVDAQETESRYCFHSVAEITNEA